jgi:hypothetical protein
MASFSSQRDLLSKRGIPSALFTSSADGDVVPEFKEVLFGLVGTDVGVAGGEVVAGAGVPDPIARAAGDEGGEVTGGAVG